MHFPETFTEFKLNIIICCLETAAFVAFYRVSRFGIQFQVVVDLLLEGQRSQFSGKGMMLVCAKLGEVASRLSPRLRFVPIHYVGVPLRVSMTHSKPNMSNAATRPPMSPASIASASS